jgi:hypothetical protein
MAVQIKQVRSGDEALFNRVAVDVFDERSIRSASPPISPNPGT